MDRGKNSRDQVYDKLLDRIQYCEMMPGEVINERALIEEFGVSRTPIRAALNALYREHLVDIFPQSGTFVSKIDLERMADFVFMRKRIDEEVYRQLAERRDPLSSKVDTLLALEEIAVNHGDWHEAVKCDYQFHKEVFRIAGHEYTWEVIEKNILPCYTRIRFFSASSQHEYLQYPTTHEEHVAIAKYIREGNMDKLRECAYTRHYSGFYSQQMQEAMLEKPECFVSVRLK